VVIVNSVYTILEAEKCIVHGIVATLCISVFSVMVIKIDGEFGLYLVNSKQHLDLLLVKRASTEPDVKNVLTLSQFGLFCVNTELAERINIILEVKFLEVLPCQPACLLQRQ
jgi:hypothetical protein